MTDAVREEAPAKVNLVLHVGPRQANGLHKVCSLFASLELHDVVTVEPAGDADKVVCPGVEGPNLAGAALEVFRSETGVALPPLHITIEKRIPVAGGLGGGSADAAAVLRAANRLAGDALDDDGLRLVAAELGSDVPSQVRPGHAVVTGTGEGVRPVELPPAWLVLVPSPHGLSTAQVFAEFDRVQAPRERLDPDPLMKLAGRPVEAIAEALENDLELAALALRPDLHHALSRLSPLEEAGALGRLVSGSGPTVFGLFADRAAAERAAAELGDTVLVTALRDHR
jgi:4-diphosphocytidyl-2-C-methyl-D-erythritol kinase